MLSLVYTPQLLLWMEAVKYRHHFQSQGAQLFCASLYTTFSILAIKGYILYPHKDINQVWCYFDLFCQIRWITTGGL